MVSMYYVNKASSQYRNEEVGAHSFCSRCGVHFLHAPNSRSTALDVNVDCLNPQDVKIKTAKSRKINLSAGRPVSDQWEHDPETHRYPATIAEENAPMATMPFDKSSPFAAYRNHPLMRHHQNQEDWDPLAADYHSTTNDTIDLTFPEDDKLENQTPSTVYTAQTDSMSVPPTLLTVDTSRPIDTESLVSLSSLRSRGAMSLKADPDAYVSPPSNAGIAPSTTPLVRHQMNFYMRKHMLSSSSISSSSPSNRTNTPRVPDGAPPRP